MEAKVEYMTEEILSMMIYSDVQENPTHPFRDSRLILNFRNKFPFNKPNGIDVSPHSVETFTEQLIQMLLSNFNTSSAVEQTVNALTMPIPKDPLVILENL